MIQEDEKAVLAHWYYSVSEWEEFLKGEKKGKKMVLWVESALALVLVFLTFYFGWNGSWAGSLAIGGGFALVYFAVKYYTRVFAYKWKGSAMPEVSITGKEVTTNGNTIIFQGNGNWLRRIDIEEKDNINVLQIMYEWNTAKGANYAEIRIPVPKGKLREAVEVQLTVGRWQSAVGS